MASAWAIIIDGGELLMLRRAPGVGRGGQWCPPGGTRHSGESALDGARRECFEESGLKVRPVGIIARYGSCTHVRCVLESPRSALVLRPREAVEARWIAPSKLLSLGPVMDLRQLLPTLRLDGFKMSLPVRLAASLRKPDPIP